MMESSAMAMPWGMARRTSPRASTRMGDPSAEVPAPVARPGRRRSAGSRVEANYTFIPQIANIKIYKEPRALRALCLLCCLSHVVEVFC
jgi:hypothetical protein